MKKGFGLVGILIVVGAIAILGGGGYYVLNNPTVDDVPEDYMSDVNDNVINSNTPQTPEPSKIIEGYVEDLDKCLHLQASSSFGMNFEEIKGVFYENLDDCLVASEISYHPNCYLEAKDTCYSSLGEQTGDLKYCEMVEDIMEREKWCYYEIAYEHKNSNACKKITTNNWRDACFNVTASLTFDRNLCNKISDEGSKEDCFNGLCWLLEKYKENPDGTIGVEKLDILEGSCKN